LDLTTVPKQAATASDMSRKKRSIMREKKPQQCYQKIKRARSYSTWGEGEWINSWNKKSRKTRRAPA